MIKLLRTEFSGVVAVLKEDANLSKWIEQKGSIKTDGMLDTVLPMMRPGECVIDVGACLGDWTVPIAERVGREGIVWAFEALPINYACLEVNIRDHANVIAHHLAISDVKEVVYMERDANAGASHVSYMGAFPVVAVPLDVFSFSPRVDWIKLDIEGYEYKALLGAARTIAKHKPKIICELNVEALKRAGASYQEVLDLMGGYGYRDELLDPRYPIGSPQIDVLFLPK